MNMPFNPPRAAAEASPADASPGFADAGRYGQRRGWRALNWQAIAATRHGEAYLGRSIIEALARPQNLESERPPAPRLSCVQAEVVRLLVDGRSIAEIAAALGCHRRTVSRKKREAMTRLGVTNDPGLFSYVRANGILGFESYI